MPSLSHADAIARAHLLTVEAYDIDLDLTGGAETFRSTTRVAFRAPAAASTFVELKPVTLRSVRLNGTELDPSALIGNRLPLTGLAGHNELVVEADMAYTNNAVGVHRYVDPVDGETYLYATSCVDEAQRIFACFDQPDLKAPITLSVSAPAHWTVAANGPLAEASPGRWRFAPTRPLPTYVMTLIAGPFHARRAEHDGIPLALYSRRSLAAELDRDAEELFEITRAGFDRFHELFGIRYPFGPYGQAFIPEFNAGALENPGLVTYRDDYLFRSAVTDAQRELRAITMIHEMAHMWFGNLVTLRWWDDLWLNESFAEYLGVRVTAEATGFRDAWTGFGILRKAWGYRADQRPSTHPVAPAEVTDTAAALVNLDGISYAKGASALRQLVAWLGDETFLRGLRDFFAGHAYGNATLADLVAALSKAGGRDLSTWTELWLRQAQVNTLVPEVRLAPDGRYEAVTVCQTAPEGFPTLRPHRIGIAAYTLGATGAAQVTRVELDLDPSVDDGRTPVPALTGVPAGDLLLLNDGDLTFAKVRLDPGSLAAAPRVLPRMADSLSRALVWLAVIEAVRDAELPVDELLDLVAAALPTESHVAVVEDVLLMSEQLVDLHLDAAWRLSARARLRRACADLVAAAGPAADSLRLAAVHGVVACTDDTAALRGWLAGDGVPGGVTVDLDLGWRILYRLAVLGAADDRTVAERLAADPGADSEEWAARCRAALPDPAAKQRAWQLIVGDGGLSNRLAEATADGFWQPEQQALTSPYVERYFAEFPQVVARRGGWAAKDLSASAFPRFAVAEETRRLAAALLARDDIDPILRRAVVDRDDVLARALAARARWAS